MGIIQSSPGAALTFGGGSGSKVYAYNNMSTTPQTVAPANPFRQQITFHNPGDVDIFVAPASVYNTGAFVALSPTTSALGGCFRIYANGGSLTFSGGEIQNAWQGFTASGAIKPFTVMDSNL